MWVEQLVTQYFNVISILTSYLGTSRIGAMKEVCHVGGHILVAFVLLELLLSGEVQSLHLPVKI